MEKLLASGKVLFGKDESQIIQIKEYLEDYMGSLKGLIEMDSRTAANAIEKQFGSREVFKNPKPIELLAHLFSFALGETDCVLDFFAGSGTSALAALDLNRKDNCERRYVLIEMESESSNLVIDRIKKDVFTASWKSGRPLELTGGVSHCMKYIRLESYEDVLSNLRLSRSEGQEASLLAGTQEFREDYMLGYMLESELGSLRLPDDAFVDPFCWKLSSSHGTAGETKAATVDLVETFNYLIGIRVKHIDHIEGFRIVEGTNSKGETVLVIWRNIAEKSNEALDAFFQKLDIRTHDQEFDIIYVNGDNNLGNLRREDETWKVRLIEDDFQRLMFDVEDI